MKVLITGAEGFVGGYLASELQDNGHEVVGTYLLEPAKKEFEMHLLNIVDSSAVEKLFLEVQPDAVVHLAAISSVKYSFENPEKTFEVNVEGTKNIIKACKKIKKKVRLLLIGSAEEYGNPVSLPMTEEHPLQPNTPYANSKIEAEKLGLAATEEIDVIVMRSFPHIGPKQSDIFVTASFAKQIAKIEKGASPVIKVGNLEAKRDFTDVRDVVRGYRFVLESGKNGEVYNLCSGQAYSIKKVLNILLSMTEVEITVTQDPDRMRPSDIPLLEGSYEKVHAATGWEPLINIENTLLEILNYWRKQS